MSRLKAVAKGASLAGVATIAVGGTAYAIERLAAGRIRRQHGDGAFDVLAPMNLLTNTIESSDGAKLSYVDVAPTAPHHAGPNGGSDGIALRPILLSHGVTLSVRTWTRQLDAFPKHGHRTIAFDHRGHGGSTLGDKKFSVDQLADDVRAMLDGLDLTDSVLVGHSMGGIAVQSFLARYPDIAQRRVAGVVLLSTLPSALSGSQAARVGQVVEQITRRAPDSTRLWANPHLGLVLARFGFGKDPVASDVELVRQMMYECDRHTRVSGPRSLIGFDLVKALARIDIPTLIIGGTADAITPERDSRRMHERVPNSRLELFEDGGHMLMLERHAAVNAMILSFAQAPTQSMLDFPWQN